MVFGSIPAYHDPSNWQQVQPNHHTGVSIPPLAPHVGSIRPGSMAERARLANIAAPDAALNCPRCESTNTKFCYFNNYSLTQPRHFCKTCRRYWTRGGALRNVPVGGGFRRNNNNNNKRSNTKPTSSNNSTTTSSSLGGFLPPQIPPPLLLGANNLVGGSGAIDQWPLQPAVQPQPQPQPQLSLFGSLNYQSPYPLFQETNQESRVLSAWPQFFTVPGSEQWAWTDVSANLN